MRGVVPSYSRARRREGGRRVGGAGGRAEVRGGTRGRGRGGKGRLRRRAEADGTREPEGEARKTHNMGAMHPPHRTDAGGVCWMPIRLVVDQAVGEKKVTVNFGTCQDREQERSTPDCDTHRVLLLSGRAAIEQAHQGGDVARFRPVGAGAWLYCLHGGVVAAVAGGTAVTFSSLSVIAPSSASRRACMSSRIRTAAAAAMPT
jgi:hypothetical protein